MSGDGEKFELCGGGFCWARLHRSGHICEGRRHLCYVAPAGEASAGEPIAMLLLNENEVAVQTGDDSEVWRRCKPAIS